MEIFVDFVVKSPLILDKHLSWRIMMIYGKSGRQFISIPQL